MRMAGLHKTASRPPKNSVFCAPPSQTSRDSDAAGRRSWLELRSQRRAAPLAESAYREMSSCHIDPECHIDNALIRIAHCDDKADNDESDLRTVQTLNGRREM
jgi:hypothetical protein